MGGLTQGFCDESSASVETLPYTDSSSPVTVVVICFNHQRFLDQSFQGVQSQTARPCHLIVVDDRSSDRSQQLITDRLGKESGRITMLLHQENRGLTRTLNECLALVDSEFVAFIAADDWMEPDRLRLQVAEFERRDERCAAVHSDLYLADEQGHRLPGTVLAEEGGRRDGDLFVESIPRCALKAPSVLLRTSAVRELGGYDESIPMEDYDLWLRLTRTFEVGYVDRPLVNYRVVSTSMSNTTDRWEFREWHIPSLFKHVDAGGFRGEAIRTRLQHLVKVLYFRGREPDQTRRDLSRLLRSRVNAEVIVLYVAAVMRVPGPMLASGYRMVSRALRKG